MEEKTEKSVCKVTARDLLRELFVSRRQGGKDMVKMVEGRKEADEFFFVGANGSCWVCSILLYPLEMCLYISTHSSRYLDSRDFVKSEPMLDTMYKVTPHCSHCVRICIFVSIFLSPTAFSPIEGQPSSLQKCSQSPHS